MLRFVAKSPGLDIASLLENYVQSCFHNSIVSLTHLGRASY